MENNSLKTVLMCVGMFLVGAIFTPIALGFFEGGDRQTSKSSEASSSQSSSDFGGNQDQATSPIFEPNDDQATVLKDYETPSPDALNNIPVTLPQFALNQPSVKPYPNYWANISIPQFAVKDSPKPKAAPATKAKKAIATPANSPTNGKTTLPPKILGDTIPILGTSPLSSFSFSQPAPTANPASEDLFQGNVQAPAGFNLKDFLDHSGENSGGNSGDRRPN